MLSIGGKLGTGARPAESEMIRIGRATREEVADRRAGSELGLDRTEKDARVNSDLAAKAAGGGGGRTQETHSKAPPTLPSPNLRTAKRGKNGLTVNPKLLLDVSETLLQPAQQSSNASYTSSLHLDLNVQTTFLPRLLAERKQPVRSGQKFAVHDERDGRQPVVVLGGRSDRTDPSGRQWHDDRSRYRDDPADLLLPAFSTGRDVDDVR